MEAQVRNYKTFIFGKHNQKWVAAECIITTDGTLTQGSNLDAIPQEFLKTLSDEFVSAGCPLNYELRVL